VHHQQVGHRHSIFCILPPDVLLDIAQTGTEEEREAALTTLAADTTFRTLRAIRLAAPVAATAQAEAAVLGQKRRTIMVARTGCPNLATKLTERAPRVSRPPVIRR
jgi:hypothetical protein